MDSSDCSTEAPPIGPLLYQQYKEQSSLCDAVIRTGLWEKRFHWCVLVASPFFENIYKNNFLEKQTGIIELDKWPAPVIEMALLFLYGTKPEVTEVDIDLLMDIAEFLLVPELKATCIEYLKGKTVTMDNCAQIYELSSVYRFMLAECDKFFKGNLLQLLEQEQMLNFTTESLKLLLADPTLRYVTVQTWFQFLVRWANKAPERQDSFVELLSLLDVSEFDKEFLDNTVAKERLVINANEEVKERLMSAQDDNNDTVLILKTDACMKKDSFVCFNMRTMLWYQMHLDLEGKADRFGNLQIAGVKNSNSSCIYKVTSGGHRNAWLNVLTYDLNNRQLSTAAVCSEYDVDDDDDDNDDDDFATCLHLDRYSVVNDTIAAVSQPPAPDDRTEDEIECQYNDLRKCRSTLYTANLNDEPVPEFRAVLTLKDDSVSKVVCSNSGSVAMLSQDYEKLFIYDESAGVLECIQLKHDYEITVEHEIQLQVTAVEDNFMLYSFDSLLCIMKSSDASLNKKHCVKHITWEQRDEDRFVLGGERWFRFSLNGAYNPGDEICIVTLEYVSLQEVMRAEDMASLCWETIPVPPEAKLACYFCRDVFSVSLQKGTTRCHLECPHCKLLAGGKGLLFNPAGVCSCDHPDVADEDDGENDIDSPEGNPFYSDQHSDSDDDNCVIA